MHRSKTNKTKNIFLGLTAWSYSFLQMLLSLTLGMLFEENRNIVRLLYESYLNKSPTDFWKEYLTLVLFLPKIFIWDRFLTRNRVGGLAVRMIYKHFAGPLPLEHELPTCGLEEILPPVPDGYVLADVSFRAGNTSAVELAYLANIVKIVKPRVCLEIGTFNGRSTLHIALNARQDAKIYTLDLPSEDREETFKNIELLFDKEQYNYLRNRIKPLYGDSRDYDFGFLKSSVDFAFVDGCHSEDYVLNDSKVVMEVLKPGGVVVWHDYLVWDGVTKALDSFAQMNPALNMVHIRGTSLVILKNNQILDSTLISAQKV